VLFQRTKSLIGGGASKGVTHPTGRLLAREAQRNENKILVAEAITG